MLKFLAGLLVALTTITAPLGETRAQVPGVNAGIVQSVSSPQCTPRITPYAATYYPRVVMVGDSITQHADVGGIANATTNPSVSVGTFTTATGNPILTYNGGDLGVLGLYTNQAISGTGINSNSQILGTLDSTHLLISINATGNGTNNLTIGGPATGAQAQWNITSDFIGELPNTQASTPYFHFDQWNDFTRNFGMVANAAAMMRGANLGYSGAATATLLPRYEEYQKLDPDILIFSVGVNNITSATFQSDMEQTVDRAHAWCPSLPIFLTNIRATGATIQSSRPPGGIVYDNSLIANIVSARPWLHSVDLSTPYANNGSTTSGLAIAGIANTISGNAVVNLTNATDARQQGIQTGQTVTGAPITGSPTIISVAANSFTLSSGAAVTSTASNQTLTFTPFAFANQTGLDINYTQSYPTNVSNDSLHPGVDGAQLLGAPALATAICSVIVGNCTPSTTHNVFLDNAGASMLTTNPAANLSGTPATINHSISGAGQVSTTATWLNTGTTMAVASATGLTIGQAITSASGLAANTYVSNIAGTTVTFAPAATGPATAQAVTFSPGASGQAPQGMDLAQGAATFSSYIASVSANSETGGNLQTITVYPAGTSNGETLVVRPAAIAVAGTACLAKWCQMFAEFEVDQNPGWISIQAKAIERLAAYSSNYFALGKIGIIPQGAGTRRFWASSPCFPFPFNSSGDSPSITITHAPSLDTGNPVIVFRRWDIRACQPSPNIYQVQH